MNGEKKETKSFGLGAACGIVRPKGDGAKVALSPATKKHRTSRWDPRPKGIVPFSRSERTDMGKE